MRELAELVSRLADLERRMAQSIRYGTIAERRINAGQVEIRAKIGVGTDGTDMLSPWVPWQQQAGAVKMMISPSVGQQVRLNAPYGEFRQASAEPFTWSTANAPPSGDLDDNVIAVGNLRIEFKDGRLLFRVGGADLLIEDGRIRATVGGVTHEVTGSGIETTGGTVKHDGKNVGADHIHGGVEQGGANTDVPAN
jgi:phage baseplate assembly protein gpV